MKWNNYTLFEGNLLGKEFVFNMCSPTPTHTAAECNGFKAFVGLIWHACKGFLNVCKGHMMLAKRKTISFQELWFSTVPSRFSARHTGFTGFLINVLQGTHDAAKRKVISLQELVSRVFWWVFARDTWCCEAYGVRQFAPKSCVFNNSKPHYCQTQWFQGFFECLQGPHDVGEA